MRHRGQRARGASDHEIRRFMAPPGRAHTPARDLARRMGSDGRGRGARRGGACGSRQAADGTVRSRPSAAGGVDPGRDPRGRLLPPPGRRRSSPAARSRSSRRRRPGSSTSSSPASAPPASGEPRPRAPRSASSGWAASPPSATPRCCRRRCCSSSRPWRRSARSGQRGGSPDSACPRCSLGPRTPWRR